MEEKIRIKMLKSAKSDIPFIDKPGTIAYEGQEYDAVSNQYGAISVICTNGEKLGIMPGEFKFIQVPDWLSKIWNKK